MMPRVLELIQEHTEFRTVNNTPFQFEKDALARLFHTLRGWELPLLFDNLNGSSTNKTTRGRGRVGRDNRLH